uniref:Secreted protein n=1 Tax=Astatotilapia calliptera TaxID=8154 RepID=A0AAX7UKX5_ASTCA
MCVGVRTCFGVCTCFSMLLFGVPLIVCVGVCRYVCVYICVDANSVKVCECMPTGIQCLYGWLCYFPLKRSVTHRRAAGTGCVWTHESGEHRARTF